MNDLAAYANFHDFRAKFRPETPYGRELHEKQCLYFDIAELEKIYDQTEVLLTLLKELQDEPSRLSLISHHLKQLPRFSEHGQSSFDEIDLFQIKKFLHNYRSLMEQLPEDTRSTFGFEYGSQALGEQLNLGQQSAETFYIADEYSPELKKIRAEISLTDAEIRESEDRRVVEIQEKFGFSFEGRAFLLVPKESLVDIALASEQMVIEPYDDKLFSVRPLACINILALVDKRHKLAQQERIVEASVLESLSIQVHAEMPKLISYRNTVLAFDLAWVRARMALQHGLTRPKLHTKNSIHIQKGIYLPCQSTCAEYGISYTPLDAIFDSATVIFGSNMGGKTVVLQTTAFLQLAAQSGFFVPAEKFMTRIFHNFYYIGERHGSPSQHGHTGLSGFAIEMQQLTEAWQSINADENGTLLLMDEFARTTSSSEAEALLAAVLEAISKKSNTLALCSTHFHRLPRIPDLKFLRMSGLKQSIELRAEKMKVEVPVYSMVAGPDGFARDGCRGGLAYPSRAKDTENLEKTGPNAISEIARHMTYSLVPDNGNQCSDAIAVARMLGVDGGLVDRAEEFWTSAM